MNAFGKIGLGLAVSLLAVSTARAVPGDSNGNGHVDFVDAVQLIDCMQGPEQVATPECRVFFDTEGDSDIDMADFAAFQACFSGDQPADPACEKHRVHIDGQCLRIDGTQAGSMVALRLEGGSTSNLIIDLESDSIPDFTFALDAFDCIVFDARGGDDEIVIDEANGAFTHLKPTTILGGSGADTVFGGSGDETFIGGPGNDTAFLGGGNDTFIWNAGDGTDLIEGATGTDTVEVNGAGTAESFTLTANGTRVRFDRLNPVPFFLDIGTCEKFVLNANGGNDSFSATGNLAALIQVTVDGGAGDDTILGSNGVDLLIGGDNNDFIDGQQGNDTIFLGAGDDTFQWDPGDGSDTVDGESGIDGLLFNGSAGSEIFTASAEGTHVLFTRNLANIAMDLNEIEVIDLNALAGTDIVTVNDLAGTSLVALYVNLSGTFGGPGGDSVADNVIVHGSGGDDILSVTYPGDVLSITGLTVDVIVEHFDPTLDVIALFGLDGHDVLDASGVGTGGPRMLLDGGPGDDILLGGVAADTLAGGPEDDILFGGLGVDVLDDTVGDNVMIQDGPNQSAGVVTLFGEEWADTITISRDGSGNILSNGQPIEGATVANTALIRIFGRGGDDTITLNESQGALPGAAIYGGAGNDTLTGGSGGDFLFGGIDNDTILGKGGTDFLFGGAAGDTLIGGDANDLDFGGAGDDEMIWNPGDDTDLNEGGGGFDTVTVNGGGGAEVFTTTANGTRVRFDRLDPAPFSLDMGTCEKLMVNANGGNDSFSATGNLAALIQITVDGGTGDDTILGSNGIDLLMGGDNNDFVDGQQGNDTIFLGSGDDTFQWDPGDGSDLIEGQAGTDKLLFNGSAGSEIFTVSAADGRVSFSRNLGNIVMDLDDVEEIELNALAGTDTVTVNSLNGTDLENVHVNLGGAIGGTSGDAAADVVIVNGTIADDIIDVVGAGTAVSVIGLSARVDIINTEGANDSLVINALAGEDGVTASTMPAGVIKLTIDGGTQDDVLLGSQGADVFLGGAGNDFIFGDNGNDVALMGADADVFQWDPGDGNDTIEGQDGADTLLFFGSNSAENVDVVANGGRVLFIRNVGSVTMDLDDVETTDFRALGGADNVVVGDLSGTNVTTVGLDLRGPNGGGDSAADTVTVNGTNGDDVFGAVGDAGGVSTFGLQADVNIFVQEAALDRLTLNALGGDDVVDATSLEADGMLLTINGGLGDDVLIGSEGSDLLTGGDGSDLALMGAGNDTFVWNPGDDNDTIEGQAGADIAQFNGSNAAETLQFSANGGRVLFTRDVASVVMDLNSVERFDFQALGGADTLVVNNLAGTSLTQVNLELAGTINGTTGDGAADLITVNGTSAADIIQVSANAGAVEVSGLSALVRIRRPEAANDRLTVNGLGGVDTITVGSGVTSLIQMITNQ